MKKFIFIVILIFLVVFIIGIAFCNKSVENFCSIYNWQAIGAIATFFIALVSLFQAIKNETAKEDIEKGKITEKIIIPLKQDLENIIKNLQDKLLISSWKWCQIKDEKIYLVRKSSFGIVKKNIVNFHNKLSETQSSSNQHYKDLENLIKQEIRKSILGKLIPIYLQSGEEIDLTSTKYTLFIGGDFTEITFFRLIFENQNLDKCVEKEQEKRYKRGLNQYLKDERYFLNGKEVKPDGDKRIDFNEIISAIFSELEKNQELQKYINECKILSKEAKKLKGEFDSFY